MSNYKIYNIKNENENKKKLKYRYTLIALLEIIIILLVISMFIINLGEKEKKKIASQAQNQNTSAENEAIISAKNEEEKIQEQKREEARIAEEKRRAEEERAKQEEEKAKQEEANAKGVIYLTFDDGPSSDSTPQVLDILEKKKVKATFFVIHYSEANEKLVKREHDDGHTVALHGYTHTYSELYKSADACVENFLKIQEQVKQTTGVESKIIRFPGGSSNTISRRYTPGVMTELTHRLVEAGFRYFDWNADSDDAGKAKTSEDVYRNVTTEIKEGRNNVVLMHDFSGNTKTVNALEAIIDYGIENGYVFRKITYETPMVTHSVNN